MNFIQKKIIYFVLLCLPQMICAAWGLDFSFLKNFNKQVQAVQSGLQNAAQQIVTTTQLIAAPAEQDTYFAGLNSRFTDPIIKSKNYYAAFCQLALKRQTATFFGVQPPALNLIWCGSSALANQLLVKHIIPFFDSTNDAFWQMDVSFPATFYAAVAYLRDLYPRDSAFQSTIVNLLLKMQTKSYFVKLINNTTYSADSNLSKSRDGLIALNDFFSNFVLSFTDSTILYANYLANCAALILQQNGTYFGVNTEVNLSIGDSVEKQQQLFWAYINPILISVPQSFWNTGSSFLNDAFKMLINCKQKMIAMPNIIAAIGPNLDAILTNSKIIDDNFFVKLFKLDSLLRVSSDRLENYFASLIQDKISLLTKTGYTQFQDILNATSLGDSSSGAAGVSILLGWMRANKDQLLRVNGITTDDISNWESSLSVLENSLLLGNSVNQLAAQLEVISQRLTILDQFKSKDSFSSDDKSAFMQNLNSLASLATYLSVDQLNRVLDILNFLNAKFNFSTDASIGSNFLTALNQFKIIPGVEYFIGQFKVAMSDLSLTNTRSITSLVQNLGKIVDLKAEFDVRNIVSQKIDFYNFVTDQLQNNQALIAYEKNSLATNLDLSISCGIENLRDDVIAQDYVNLLSHWSDMRTDLLLGNVSFFNLINSVVTSLSSTTTTLIIQELSLPDVNSLNASISQINNKSIDNKLTLIPQNINNFDFANRLNFLTLIANANKDSLSKSWSQNNMFTAAINSVNFFAFVRMVFGCTSFSPDLNNPVHKFGMISLFDFISKSIVNFQQNLSPQSISFLRLNQIKNNVQLMLSQLTTSTILTTK